VSGPVEHIRTRLQVQTGNNVQYRGPLHCLRQISSHHGLAGVYKGQVPTLIRELHGYGVYFFTYEYLIARECRQRGVKRSELPTWTVMTFGGLSGYTLW
jgi:solute carrier family 25 carnitine/acylcarnitine transporter 20/29